MHALLRLLSEQPILLLAVLLGLGSLLGSLRYHGVHLGPAAVLFGAIAISSAGTAAGLTLEVPEVVGTLGLVLFTYTVGLLSGPNFFASLRRGWVSMVAVVGVFVVVGVAGVVGGRLLGLSSPVIAGTLAGALTNTPALAAASERAGDTSGPTIGYSIAYLFGVAAMLVAAMLVLRSRSDERARNPLTNLTVRVELDDPVCVHDSHRRWAGSCGGTGCATAGAPVLARLGVPTAGPGLPPDHAFSGGSCWAHRRRARPGRAFWRGRHPGSPWRP